MGFSRQEYWSGLPCPPPGDLPNPGTEPTSLMSPALAGRFLTTEPPGELSNTWLWAKACEKMAKPLIIKVQVRTPMNCHFTLIRRPSSKQLQIINAREDVENKEPQYPLVALKLCSYYGEVYGGYLKTKNAVTTWSSNPIPGFCLEKTLIQKDNVLQGS